MKHHRPLQMIYTLYYIYLLDDVFDILGIKDVVEYINTVNISAKEY